MTDNIKALIDQIDETLGYFVDEFANNSYVWAKPISHHCGGITPTDLVAIRAALYTRTPDFAKMVDDLRVAKEALGWSRCMIKFQVKPERCVEIGDNVKSAIALYEDIQNALTRLKPYEKLFEKEGGE